MRFTLSILFFLSLTLTVAAQLAEPPKSGPKLQIREVSVLGNTVLAESIIDKIVAPYQGRDLSLTEMKQLAKSLEDEYRDQGFLLVKVVLPAQKPDGGLLLLQVLEPTLEDIAVEGNSRYSSEYLRSRFQHHLTTSTYRSQDLEKSLLLLNDLPDLKVKAVLRPGESPDTSRVVLVAEEDKPYHFTLAYNNFGTRLTGEHRAGLTGEFSNLASQGDLLTVGGFLATPSDSTTILSGNYSLPINKSGTRLGIGYATGNYSVGQELEALNIRGETEIASLSVSHPLARSFSYSSDLSLQLSSNDIVNRALSRPLSEDKYVALRLDYTNQWQDESGRTVLRGGVSQGLGGTRRGDPRASRRGAGADFTKVQIDAARVQQLSEQFSFIGRGSAQFTNRPLFAVEQMSVGGADSVRGFNPAEVLGDQGYLLSAELRWSPLAKNRDLFQTVIFVDHGGVTQKKAPPRLPGSRQLTGAGFGFRVNHKETRARLDFGFPISPDRNQLSRSPVIYGQVTTRF